jgi:hypothetical protein
MPVSVEQVAMVIQQMDIEERRRLIALVPDLRDVLIPRRTLRQAKASARVLQQELRERMGGEYLKSDQPFLGDMTLQAYWALPDKERARLWAEWSAEAWDDCE